MKKKKKKKEKYTKISINRTEKQKVLSIKYFKPTMHEEFDESEALIETHTAIEIVFWHIHGRSESFHNIVIPCSNTFSAYVINISFNYLLWNISFPILNPFSGTKWDAHQKEKQNLEETCLQVKIKM